VAVGGSTGQVLQKLSGVNYDTGWLTLPANYITSVTAPLAVTAGNLAVDLSAYLTSATAASTYQTLAGMSSYLTTATAASTYAVIAAGQPVAGSTGQVLTKNSGTNYDSIWTTIVPGDRYLTTSTTSNTLSNTTKTFTIGTGLSYTPTQSIAISYDASNHMHGEVLTYNSGTGVLTVDINHHTGAGTYAAWVVNVGGVVPATSVAWGDITGTLSSQTDLQSALDLKLDATTAASTYYLQTNPDGFITSAALTGYATESFVTSQGYITQATADGLYYSISNPSAFLAFDANGRLTFGSGTNPDPTPLAGRFWFQSDKFRYSTSSSSLGNVIATESWVSNAYAPLSSPSFSGTPSLPTGTIGVTQTAGNNTTALATTAFVTAAVPAFATVAQTIVGTSSTTAIAPSIIGAIVSHPELRPLNYFTQTAISGSGGVTSGALAYGQREMFLGSLAIGRAAWQYGIPGSNANNMSRADFRKLNFSKKVWMSGKAMVYSTTGFGTSYPGDANTFARITLGGYGGNATGDMTVMGIGWKKQGGSAPFFTLTVHNGTTLTDVASTIAATDNQSIDWLIYSDGTGNVTLYINGAQAATTSAGPTGITANYQNAYREQVEAATTPAARQLIESTGGFLFIEG
jgi:hypothetical protein